jgi:sigma-54 dependent transcriptional regulator, acetoin dehydrogenase operon transcriptional activator AcoR
VIDEGVAVSGGQPVTNGAATATNGASGLQVAYLTHRAHSRIPLAAIDPGGRVVIADPALADVLRDELVGELLARLAEAIGDGPALTVRPVHRGRRLRGVLVGAADPPRLEAPALPRVVGMHGDHILLLAPQEVRVAEADGATVWLITERGRLRCGERGLTRLEERLSDHGFLRVHRHYLVNLRRVREIAPTFRGGMSLVLDGPDRPAVPVSRRRSAYVRARLCL